MMLRLTLERVGPGGTAKPIGHAVIGRWAGRHIAAVADDRTGHHVGQVESHDPQAGPWALVVDAIDACLGGDAELTEPQRRTLERAMRKAASRDHGEPERGVSVDLSPDPVDVEEVPSQAERRARIAQLQAEYRQRLSVMSREQLETLEGLADDARGGALDADGQAEIGTLVLAALREIRSLRVELYAVVDYVVGSDDEGESSPGR